jgi:hypothetical protein
MSDSKIFHLLELIRSEKISRPKFSSLIFDACLGGDNQIKHCLKNKTYPAKSG